MCRNLSNASTNPASCFSSDKNLIITSRTTAGSSSASGICTNGIKEAFV